MFKYKTEQIQDGFDCWGKMEYKTIYKFYYGDKYLFTIDEYQEDPEKILDRLNSII